jgi:hypothetical protein
VPVEQLPLARETSARQNQVLGGLLAEEGKWVLPLNVQNLLSQDFSGDFGGIIVYDSAIPVCQI